MSDGKKLYNACIFAKPQESIQEIVKDLRITDGKILHWEMNEEPHCTVFFGPSIYEGETDPTDPAVIDKFLGGFVTKFSGSFPRYTVKGVTFFDNDPRFNVVKINIESPKLNEMHHYLKGETKHGYTNPDTCNMHFTLGYVKKMDTEQMKLLCNSIEEKLAKTGVINNEFVMAEIQFKTPIERELVSLWN